MKNRPAYLLLLLLTVWLPAPSYSVPVEQIHLSFSEDPASMVVMWSTAQALSDSSLVRYGSSQSQLTLTETAVTWQFTDGNPLGLHYLHKAILKGLSPGTKYWYKVQSGTNESSIFHFVSMQAGQKWSPSFIVYGDMGRSGGAQSLPALTKEVASGEHVAILHVGDFAYDLDSAGGVNGDQFMNRIQDLAAYLPYMTCPGNHESGFNFSHYVNRFAMPKTSSSPHWYSWNIGPVHFISYSSEVYFDGWGVQEQYDWLEKDLQSANAPENRSVCPWIITYGHRPMYCSNLDGDDCTTSKSKVRAGLESLFYKYGVDIILEAHEHDYERLWPVYNETVTSKDYVNPKAPIHIISGTAGCNENDGLCFDVMLGPRGPWSAFRSWWPSRHGFGRLKVVNGTHVHWEQVIASDQRVEDEIWIIQDSHGKHY